MPPTRKHRKSEKKKSCRICLSASRENSFSFDVHSEWSRLIEYCFGTAVIEEIGPRVLCEKCSTKLKEFADFKTLALQSYTLWNNDIIEIKKDPVEDNIEMVVKDEHEDHSDNCPDTDYTEIDYHDKDYVPDISHGEIKKEDVAHELVIQDKVRPKKHKKQNKIQENNAQDDLLELSEYQFVQKYFTEIKSNKKAVKRKYECEKCGDKFTHITSLPKHVQKCYKSEVLMVKPIKPQREKIISTVTPSVFDCGLCEFQNPDENVVMKHVREQHCLANDMACKLCDYVGRDTADFVTHRYKHIPEEYKYKGKYSCPTCNKIRMNELSLQFHYRNLHLKKPGGWCPVCHKTFTGYIYFRNHMRLHLEAKYICDLCGAKFLFRNLIISHIKEHMNVRNYICDTCGKSFKRNNALLGHVRAYHTDYKPVPCDHCNKQFKNAYSLRLHMKMVRKGNSFICDVCCKGYATMSLLKKHMFWHTGERPFSCETCGGKYKSKGNLKLHMKRHMGIYPFKCSSCEKQFLTSTQLKAHSSVHTGIRRVKCLACDRTFHEKRQMLAHCQSKHESLLVKHEIQQRTALESGLSVPRVTQVP